jgi:hypothetical protein
MSVSKRERERDTQKINRRIEIITSCGASFFFGYY